MQIPIGTKVRVQSGQWKDQTATVIRPSANTAREYTRVKIDGGSRVRVLTESLVVMNDE